MRRNSIHADIKEKTDILKGVDDFDWHWDILDENLSIDDFECAEHDHHFEKFLKDFAVKYQNERLAVTYVILLMKELWRIFR